MKFPMFGIGLLIAGMATASVELRFPVASTNTGADRLDAGTLLFDFTVDGSGGVVLDASTTSSDPLAVATVNGWDGSVGSISDPALFNTSFQLTASGSRAGSSNSISLDGYQGGQLGIYGQNASRVDGASLATPAIEVLEWEITSGSPEFEILNWVYTSDNGISDAILYDADTMITNFNLAGRIGTNTLTDFSLQVGEVLGFTQPTNGTHGFGVAGLTFDAVADPIPPNLTTGIVQLVFDNNLSQRIVNTPIQLDFSIDGSGYVTLDASTTSSDSNAISTVNAWDGVIALYTNPVVFNSTFGLTIEADKVSGSGTLNLGEVGEGGLAVSGQNSSRIDGGGLTEPNPEIIKIIPTSGAAKIDFKSVSWNNSVNNVNMTAATGALAATNAISSQPGTWMLDGFTVSSGQALELSTASANGYALAGLSFHLDVPNVVPSTNELPNIVVILADDLGYSDISHNPYSAPEVSTPHIDNLISNGVWFSDAYASGNICAPSRAGFLSGCYQQRIGVHNETDVNGSGFTSTFPYFPQHLKQQFDGIDDYTSIMVGKWHQGRDRNATVSVDGNTDGDYTSDEFDYGDAVPATLKYNPLKRGFDQVYGFVDLGGSSYWNYGRGFFDQLYRHPYEGHIDGVDDGDAIETYMTTRFTEEACAFIDEQSAEDKPFFVYLSYNAVHTPMDAPSTPPGLNQGDEGWYPDAAWFDANYPNMWQTPSYPYTGMTDQEKQYTRAILMAMLYHMDEGIGQVMDCLTTNGVLDNTIVVFWSDNGGSQASVAANEPLRQRKHFNYEGGVRVPMTISWPDGLGEFHGTTNHAPVMSIDILPTVLDAAGIEPLNGFQALDGKSWLPLIRGDVNNLHTSLCWSEGGGSGEYSIRMGDWKLYIDEDQYELYNLKDDIGEANDLASSEPEKLRELRQAFYAWMDEMTSASGDHIDERLWSYGQSSVPVAGEAAGELHSYEVTENQFVIEYDEKVGWVTNGTAIEVTDSLTNSWQSLTPDSVEQLDRYLDTATFRAQYSSEATQRFFRVVTP